MAKRKLVALDAGHGLNTAGKRTPDGIREWTLNDKVRDHVVRFLMDYNVEFIFPDGNEGKKDESLSSRLQMYLNAAVDAVVSMHHNAFKGIWGAANGVETYVDKKPTTADLRLAECIHKRLVEYTGLQDRGIKKENWYVINQNKVPAVLTEGGFMDNKGDYAVITSEAGQKAYARAVAEGLIEFLDLRKKSNAPTSKPSNSKKDLGQVHVTYQAYTDRWWPAVINKNDCAGKGDGTPIKYLAICVNKGKIRGRVYTEKGGWLPYLTFSDSYNLKDLDYGVLGDGSPIQAVELYYYTPDGYLYKKVHYRVSSSESKEYYAVQIDNEKKTGMDGYAGKIGCFIDKLQVWIE